LYEHESVGEKGYMNQQMNSIGTTGNFEYTRDLFRVWSALSSENLRGEMQMQATSSDLHSAAPREKLGSCNGNCMRQLIGYEGHHKPKSRGTST
jgi:hypothetical protein